MDEDEKERLRHDLQIKQHDQDIRTAERAHDMHKAGSTPMFNSVISAGSEALKATMLICGGSAAATLAFIGSMSANRQLPLAAALEPPLACFAMALTAACVATSVTYLGQLFYAKSRDLVDFTWKPPYITPQKSQKYWENIGRTFHALSVATVIVAYFILLYGYWAAYQAITTVGFH